MSNINSLTVRRVNDLLPWLCYQFSCRVVSDSLQPHGLQHARLPCPSATPGVHSTCCPSSRWCHPTISSSVVPFSSCLQSFPESGSFSMSQFFTSGGRSTGASASASVLPVNIQDWFPLELTGLISLQPKRLSRVFSNTTFQKHQFFGAQLSLWSRLCYKACYNTVCLLWRFTRWGEKGKFIWLGDFSFPGWPLLCSFIVSILNCLCPVYPCFPGGASGKERKWSESEVAQSCSFFATLWTVAYQAPPSMGFFRQECWSGLPFPSPGDLPDPGTHLQMQASLVLLLCLLSGIKRHKGSRMSDSTVPWPTRP